MAQISKKWLENSCIDGNKLDSTASFTMANLNVTTDSTVGGKFYVGNAWNTGHLVMGGYHFWVDTTSGGRLRIKLGAPLSDSDGVVVGNQS